MASMAATVGTWPEHVDTEWTVDMLDTLPDNGLRYEILDGVLLVSPSPAVRHQVALSELVGLLLAACPPSHRVLFAPLDWQPDRHTSLQPDILVLARDAYTAERITGTPELVIEALSPTTARVDRLLKFSRYAEGGIGQYWIVDPGLRGAPPSIEVYDLVDGAYHLRAQARGHEAITFDGPVPVTLSPSLLVEP